MYYEEVFCSVQGEGEDAGFPCIFIRFWGCPIGCSFCDQPQDPSSKKSITVERLMAKVGRHKGIRRVCITGGEPLAQEGMVPLAQELLHEGYLVSIETSGCLPIPDVGYRRSFRFVMDVKCPCSGVSEKNVYENLLRLQTNDEVKFVVRDKGDYEFMKKVLRRYPTSAKVLVSPVFEGGKPAIGRELAQWLIDDRLNYRLMLQMHKVLGVK